MITSVLAAMLVASLAVPAEAVLVRKLPQGTARFFDDFEGSAHNAPSSAIVGTWTGDPGPDPNDRNTSDPGGANNGDQWAQINNGNASATFPKYNSGTISASFAINIVGGTNSADFGWSILLRDDAGNAATQLSYDNDGVTFDKRIREISSGSETVTGAEFDLGDWLEITVEYEIGTTSATYSIKNVTKNLVFADYVASVNSRSNIAEVQFKSGAPSTFYIDDIPEPSTVGLMVIGCLALLRRRRSAA
jgi:hypothetical protein